MTTTMNLKHHKVAYIYCKAVRFSVALVVEGTREIFHPLGSFFDRSSIVSSLRLLILLHPFAAKRLVRLLAADNLQSTAEIL